MYKRQIYDLASLTKILVSVPLLLKEFTHKNFDLTTKLADWFPDKDLNDKHFSIIEFSPVNMKILQLSRDGHIRVNFVKINNEWEGSFIVP